MEKLKNVYQSYGFSLDRLEFIACIQWRSFSDNVFSATRRAPILSSNITKKKYNK